MHNGGSGIDGAHHNRGRSASGGSGSGGAGNTWDFEEDHLLSYFLGGDNANSHASGSAGSGNNDGIHDGNNEHHASAVADALAAAVPDPSNSHPNIPSVLRSPTKRSNSSGSSSSSGPGYHTGTPPSGKRSVRVTTIGGIATSPLARPGKGGSSSSSLRSNNSAGNMKPSGNSPRIRFVIGGEEAPPLPPDASSVRTPAMQFYGPSGTSSNSASPSGPKPKNMNRGSFTHGRVPSSMELSTESSSSSLEKLGAAMAYGSSSDAVMQVHKTLQMRASELPTPPTPGHMMNMGFSTSPLSPAAQIGTPEMMLLPGMTMMPPPPPRWPTGSQQYQQQQQPFPGPPMPPGLTPEQQQQFYIQQQQFLAASMAAQQQAQAQAQAQGHAHGAQPTYPPTFPYQHGMQPPQMFMHQQQPSDIMSPDSSPSRLPPMPEVDSSDIVKAAAAAGLINPDLARGHRGGASSSGSQRETPEKRAKRLARNRESARRSRRAKKELLETLSAKVNTLQDELEVERRNVINALEANLSRSSVIGKVECDFLEQNIEEVVHASAPHSEARAAITNFQFEALENALQPNYGKFLLWLSTQSNDFLSAGKDARAKITSSEKPWSKMSSKQIGEEMFSDHKKKSRSKTAFSVNAGDPKCFWPMLCYDLSISVDQEDCKITRWHESSTRSSALPSDRVKTSTAKSMSNSLQNGIQVSSTAVHNRSAKALLDVLTPEQSAKFLMWYQANKGRCEKVVANRGGANEGGAAKNTGSMMDMCEQLNRVLHFNG